MKRELTIRIAPDGAAMFAGPVFRVPSRTAWVDCDLRFWIAPPQPVFGMLFLTLHPVNEFEQTVLAADFDFSWHCSVGSPLLRCRVRRVGGERTEPDYAGSERGRGYRRATGRRLCAACCRFNL